MSLRTTSLDTKSYKDFREFPESCATSFEEYQVPEPIVSVPPIRRTRYDEDEWVWPEIKMPDLC